MRIRKFAVTIYDKTIFFYEFLRILKNFVKLAIFYEF